MRKWSVFLWPVVFAAMSDMTISAGPPIISISFCGAVSSRKSSCDELDAGHRVDGQKIDADHPALAVGAADPLCRDLRPAAGGGAEIHHPLAGLQEPKLLVDLEELVGRAGSIALALGARHVGIVELPLEPFLRRERAFARGLQALLERAGAGSALVGHRPVPSPPDAVLAHHVHQDAFPQAAVGDAQAFGGKGPTDGLQDRAAGKDEVRPLPADAGIGGAFLETRLDQPRRAPRRRRGHSSTSRRPGGGRSAAARDGCRRRS